MNGEEYVDVTKFYTLVRNIRYRTKRDLGGVGFICKRDIRYDQVMCDC